MDVSQLIDDLIDREGGYVNHPADRGGATCWGITEAVATESCAMSLEQLNINIADVIIFDDTLPEPFPC